MKVTTLTQFENGIERVAEKITQCETELAGKLDSTGKAETAGTADNAIRDGEGNVIASTYLKKTDNVDVDLTEYQTAAQADAKYLGKNDTAANAEKATKDGQNRNIADTYLEKSVWKEFGVSSADKEGTEGYVPAPPATSDTKLLTNFGWKDPQNTQIAISTVPSQNGSVTYDGTAKTPTWLNYDPLKLQISGDYQNKTNAGTYPVGFKPLGIYTWSNGTQDIQYTTWAIGKAVGSLSLSAESGSVNIDATKTFTVNRAGDGAITANSSNSNIATASVSGNTVTITGKAAGSATITVKVAEGTNHFAPANKTYAVTVTKIPLSLSASISGAVTYNTTGTINISGNSGGGAVTATSANSSYVTVSSTTTGTVTVKCANYSATATRITINVAETPKYASGTCTCNVTTAKAAGSITLSKTAGTVTYGQSDTFTVKTNLSGGTLSVTSADTNYARASISSSTVTVSCANYRSGNTVITVKSAATTNYNEATATYTLTPAKANISPSASISGTVTYNTTGTINISGNTSGGSVTATSADTNSVSIVGTSTNTVTVKCTNYKSSAVNVTINIAASTNYNSGTCTCSVTTAKATPTFSLSTESVTLTPSNPTATVTVTTNSDGKITADPYSPELVTASIDSNVITISTYWRDVHRISVYVAESNNFTATSNKIIVVDADRINVNLLDYMSISNLKSGINNFNGGLLSGDYFDFTIPTAITLDEGNTIPANSTWRAVCIGVNHNVTHESNYGAHFMIGWTPDKLRICFFGKKMNSQDTNVGGWASSELRAWLNSTFYNALPTELKNAITEWKKYTDNTGQNSGQQSDVTLTRDKIWILSGVEIAGTISNYDNPYEKNYQQQYEYFANGNYRGDGHYVSNAYWCLKHSAITDSSAHKYDYPLCGSFWTRSVYCDPGETFQAFRTFQPGSTYADTNTTANVVIGFIPCFVIA